MKHDQSTDTAEKPVQLISPLGILLCPDQEIALSAKNRAIEALAHRLGRFVAERLLNDLKASSSPNTPV